MDETKGGYPPERRFNTSRVKTERRNLTPTSEEAPPLNYEPNPHASYEQRAEDARITALLQLAQQTHAMQVRHGDALQEHLDSSPIELQEAISTVSRELKASVQDSLTKAFEQYTNKAFVDGDMAKHKGEHLYYNAAREERADWWKKLFFEISKGVALAFVLWAGVTLWNAFTQVPK